MTPLRIGKVVHRPDLHNSNSTNPEKKNHTEYYHTICETTSLKYYNSQPSTT